MANRYWVGGSGDWSSTTHWSTSSGGSSGASVPGSVDYAIVDGNSGSPGFTITISSNTAGFLYFYAQSAVSCTVQLNADMVLGSSSGAAYLYTDGSLTYSGTGAITTASTAQSLTIYGASTIPALKHNASTGSLILQANVQITNAFTWSSGTFYMNGYSTNSKTFVLSGSNTKNISAGGAKINVNGTNGTIVDTTSVAGLSGNSIGAIPIELAGGGGIVSNTRTVVATTEYISLTVASGLNQDTIAVVGASTFARIGNINATNHNGTFDMSNSTYGINILGTTATFPSTATYTSATVYFALQTNSTTLTTSGQNVSLQMYFGYVSASPVSVFYSLTLGSNVQLNNACYLGGGVLNLNANVLTVPTFGVTGSYSHQIVYGGGSIKTATFNYPSSVSLSASATAGTIEFTSSSPNTFNPGPTSNPGFANVTLKLSGSGTLTLSSGYVTIGELVTSYANNSIYFRASQVHYITNFNVSGSGSTPVNLFSDSSGTQWYLYNTGTVNVGNVRLKDAATTGGGTFNATSSASYGNVTGWNFIVPSGFIMFF